jgi:signal transduction histidine kinase
MNAPGLEGIRALIIASDSADSRGVADLLSEAGCRTRLVDTIDGISEGESDFSPDVILVDPALGLADCGKGPADGRTLVESLSEMPATAGVPLIFQAEESLLPEILDDLEMLGADYIPKSADAREVRVRVHSQARHFLRREELARSVETKDRFFSLVAHDLQGPLSGFLGAAKVLSTAAERGDTESIKELAAALDQSASTTQRLLENLLHWSRIQEQRVPYHPEPLTLETLLRRAVESAADEASTKGIEITLHLEENLRVRADRSVLRTVLDNLLSNAVKYSEEGKAVSLVLERQANSAVIRVEDRGIGISAENQARIFQIDVKTHTPGTAGEKGSGLGLVISKDFTGLMGGELQIESEEGAGTRAVLRLPLLEP